MNGKKPKDHLLERIEAKILNAEKMVVLANNKIKARTTHAINASTEIRGMVDAGARSKTQLNRGEFEGIRRRLLALAEGSRNGTELQVRAQLEAIDRHLLK